MHYVGFIALICLTYKIESSEKQTGICAKHNAQNGLKQLC